MISAHSLYLLRLAYYAAFIGAWAFLLTSEGGKGSFATPPRRWRHIARNVALFLLGVLVADGFVGMGLLGIGERLNLQPDGLLTPLGLPIWALIVVGFLAADFAGYLFHRLSHHWRWLWLIHSVHHSDTHLDASTAIRQHPVEMVCDVAILATTMLALGVPLWVEGLRATVVNPQAMVQHANLRYPPWVERAFAWLLVSPAIHRVHHSPDMLQTNTNFGIMFSFWDRLFGTYCAPASAPSARVGLDRLQDDRWQSFPGMLLTPINARGIPAL